MSSIYLDGETVAEARDALRRGVPIEQLASRLAIAPDALESLVTLHSRIRVRPVSVDAEIDLWADSSGVL